MLQAQNRGEASAQVNVKGLIFSKHKKKGNLIFSQVLELLKSFHNSDADHFNQRYFKTFRTRFEANSDEKVCTDIIRMYDSLESNKKWLNTLPGDENSSFNNTPSKDNTIRQQASGSQKL